MTTRKCDEGQNGETSVIVPEEIWTTDDVASYLKVSENFVRALAKKRELPGAFQIGTLWRFNAEKVREFARGVAAA